MADFPWDPLLGGAPADTAETLHAPERGASFAHATTSMDPPAQPVWEMLRDYRGPDLGRAAEDVEVLSALSWCATREAIPEWLGAARSQGDAPEPVQALAAEHAQVQRLCARLSDRDYALRLSILRLHARAGQVEAQLAFLDVGPTGRWLDPDREHLPLDGPQLAAWRQELLEYLSQAAAVRPGDALSTLSFLYDPGTPVQADDPVFGPLRDPVEGHAYRLLWQDYPSSTVSASSAAAFVRREAARLTSEQRAQAHARAAVLRRQWALPPPPSPVAASR